MAEITIAAINTTNRWQVPGGSVSVRIYAATTFINSDGEIVQRDTGTMQDALTIIPCSVGSQSISIPAFTIDSTEDSITDTTATYIAYLYKGTKRVGLLFDTLDQFAVPSSLGPSITWAQLIIFNQANLPIIDDTTYSKTEVNNLIAEQIVNIALGDASTTVKGGTKLSAAPSASNNPIAVGTNDLFYTAQVQTRYVAAYASLSAAVAAIGSSALTKLVVSASHTVAADLTIPANIQLDFEAGGLISVNSGKILTIGSMRDPGMRKVFTGAGNVVLGKNAVQQVCLAWWITDDTQDATKALNNLCSSLASGGTAYIPAGTWKTTTGIAQPKGSTIRGAGQLATVIRSNGAPKLVSVSASSVDFGLKQQYMTDLTLDGNNEGSPGVLLQGVYPYSVFYVGFERVTFRWCQTGAKVLSGDNNWEVENLSFRGCTFQQNDIHFSVNSPNGAVQFEQCYFYGKSGTICIDNLASGAMSFRDCLGFGLPTGVASNDGSTFFRRGSVHGAITVSGWQDEGLEYFFSTSANHYLEGRFKVENSLIQAKVMFNANSTFVSENNLYFHAAFRNAAGVTAVVHSNGDYCHPRDFNNTPVANANFDAFTGDSSLFATRSDNSTYQRLDGWHLKARPGKTFLNTNETISPAFPGTNTKKPILELIGENVSQPLLRLTDVNAVDPTIHYAFDFLRDDGTLGRPGYLVIRGNQSGFNGVYFTSIVDVAGDLNVGGYSRALTAAAGDKSTKLATTQFVQTESLLTNTFYSGPTSVPTVLKSSIHRLNTSNVTFTDSGIPIGATLYLYAVGSGAYFQFNGAGYFYTNNFATSDTSGASYGRWTTGAGGGSLIMIKLANDTWMIYIKTGTWTFSAA